jgi:hypothetical protein
MLYFGRRIFGSHVAALERPGPCPLCASVIPRRVVVGGRGDILFLQRVMGACELNGCSAESCSAFVLILGKLSLGG